MGAQSAAGVPKPEEPSTKPAKTKPMRTAWMRASRVIELNIVLIEAMAPDCLSVFMRKIAPKMMKIVESALRKPASVWARAPWRLMPQTRMPTTQARSHAVMSERVAGWLKKTIITTQARMGTAAIKEYMREPPSITGGYEKSCDVTVSGRAFRL